MMSTDDPVPRLLEALAEANTWPERFKAQLEAGADILLICEDQKRVLEGIQLIRKKMIQGGISMKRLQQSVERLMKAKSRFLGKRKRVSLEEVRAYFSC